MPATDTPEQLEHATADAIRAELFRANVTSSLAGCDLEAVLRNPERRDYFTRRGYKIYGPKRQPICYLTVGQDLADLHRRILSFSDACPEIACRPLFYHKTGDWEYLGTELFDAQNVDGLVFSGKLPVEDAVKLGERALIALEHTMKKSSSAAASRELDGFFAKVLASPLFGGLDRPFLSDVVFPFIRNGALEGQQYIRWTNGDFVPRNLLVGAQGSLRLVDCEFASQTHFFLEDFWRWRTYSTLPAGSRELAQSRGRDSKSAWSEAYFLLHQLIVIHEVNGASVAVSEARRAIERLLTLMTETHTGFRASLFFELLVNRANAPVASAVSSAGNMAQLFWKQGDDFCEEKSIRIEFDPASEAELSFKLPPLSGVVRLRFDPVCAVGMVKIISIRLLAAGQACPLLAFDSSTGWIPIQLGAELLQLADAPALTLLSVGADPLLFLPEFDVGEFLDDVVCEVRMTFAAQLVSLPQYVQAWKLSLPDARVLELQGLLTDLERALGESEGERRRFVNERFAIDDAMANEREEMRRKDQASLDLAVQHERLTEDLAAAKTEASSLTAAMERFRAEREVEVSALNAQLREAVSTHGTAVTTLAVQHERLTEDLAAAKTEAASLTAAMERFRAEHGVEVSALNARFREAVSAHGAVIAALAAQHAREIALRVEKRIELEAAVAAESAESARHLAAIESLREVHGRQLHLLEQEVAAKLAGCDEQIRSLAHTIEQMKGSASWRVTRPFRWLRDTIEGRRSA